MGNDLVIIGAGGFGREASLLVEEINRCSNRVEKWHLVGFIDEDSKLWGRKLRGYPVLGGLDVLAELDSNVQVICVIGKPADKKKIVHKISAMERRFATLIHPGVNVCDEVYLGNGVLLNKGCLLTVNIKIADHVSINPGCGIGHDVSIGEFSTLMWRVNLSGDVKIGEGCMIGTGATVLQNKNIGSWCSIGAGAVVTGDLPGNCTAVGVPATIK